MSESKSGSHKITFTAEQFQMMLYCLETRAKTLEVRSRLVKNSAMTVSSNGLIILMNEMRWNHVKDDGTVDIVAAYGSWARIHEAVVKVRWSLEGESKALELTSPKEERHQCEELARTADKVASLIRKPLLATF